MIPHIDVCTPLVDIVFADANTSPEHWQSHYQFSGHTLLDLQWMQTLNDADQDCINNWLQQSQVRYEIEGARRKLVYDDLPAAIISYPYPKSLYNRLRKYLSAMPTTKMSAQQWRQSLLNLRNKGISQEELDWSGILTYLNQPAFASGASLDTQMVLANVDFSNIRIDMCNELDNTQNNKLAHRAKYRYLSLYGGEDYREWLISLPDYQASHFSAHFTERNILLHIRTKTRFDSQGRKLLFIEEIQSDWHQVRVKKTNCFVAHKIPPAPFQKKWVGLGVKLMLLHAAHEGFDGLSWTPGDSQQSRYTVDIPSIRRIYDKTIGKHLVALSRTWGGCVASTKLTAKVPWFQIKRNSSVRRFENRHVSIRLADYNSRATLSVLEQYLRVETIKCPLFILPEAMVESIRVAGLPLFGDQTWF